MKFALAPVPYRIGVPARRLSVLLVCASLVALSASTSFDRASAQTDCIPASIASGSLDTCFGDNGLVSTSFTPNHFARGIAIQADGKSVVISTGRHPSGTGTDFYALRYHTDGILDSTFGTGGIVRVTFTAAADSEFPRAIAVQPDGKILLAGGAYIKKNTHGFAVARLNTDGSPDGTFGSGGKSFFGFSGSALATALTLQSDGKIVVAGSHGTSFAVARLDMNGNLDAGFGSGGKVTVATVVKNGSDTVGGGYAVGIQVISGEERIVVAGGRPSTAALSRDFALMRFLPNGALDGSFGSGGKVFTDFSGDVDRAHALVISGTTIIAAGITNRDGTDAGIDFGLARYNLNGSLDSTFGAGGKVSTDIPGRGNIIDGLALQPDGKIVAAGSAMLSVGIGDFAVVRYDSGGNLDPAFGSAGIVLTDFYGQDDSATGGLALQADGRIVVAGLANMASYVALARYMP